MKTSITDKKNNLENLSKDLEIGSLINLSFILNSQQIAEYTITDDVVMNGKIWLPIHNCFNNSPSFSFSSS